MSREVRMVPGDWQHPRDEHGKFIPLLGGSFADRLARWDEDAGQWARGFVRDFVTGTWEPKADKYASLSFEEWDGRRPEVSDYMPDWPPERRTHYQMYETTSEGTPISPIAATPECLAKWLADNGASAFGDMTATYDEWLGMIRKGWAPGMIIAGGHMDSGVAFVSRSPAT